MTAEPTRHRHSRWRHWVLVGLVALLLLTWAIALLSPMGPYLVALAALALVTVFLKYRLDRLRLAAEFRAQHGATGRDMLIVYSDSSRWHDYIEREWLPRWGHRAVTLDRSRPWNPDHVEGRLWRAVAGAREHTPVIIIVARGRVRVFRFWLAFRAYERGDPSQLQLLERAVAASLTG